MNQKSEDAVIRDVWRKSHGYTPEMLYSAAQELEWLLDDPRYLDPNFTPPEGVQMFFGLGKKMEAEAVRMISQGPPYEPRMELEGSFAMSQIQAFFPKPWVEFLKRVGMHDTIMTAEMLKEWEPLLDEGVALRNGNLLSNRPWALTDPAWTLVTPYYIARLLDPSITVPFPTNPAWIKVDDAETLSFGITGDWGTGWYFDGEDQLCPPDAILQQMLKLGVDYTVHLGDIYPLGASQFFDRFLKSWKPGRRGTFTLNGNHEMYAWGKGYYEVALRHPMFAQQQGTGYFALEFGDWIVVGLDVAYYSEPPWMYYGKVQDQAQKEFLQKVREHVERTGQRVFMLTHHHVLNPEGTETNPLWDDVVADDALGKAPDYWYYGHYHSAAVYSEHSAAGPDTKVRVMGHGSIPFAVAHELKENCGPSMPIECYPNTHFDDDIPEHRGRVMNGFALVTLAKDGRITERFLNQDGSDMCG